MLTNYTELDSLPVGSIIKDEDGIFHIDTRESSDDKIILTPGSTAVFSLKAVQFPAEVLYTPTV